MLFWSNSNVFSLIICKVYTKRENTVARILDLKKLRQRYLLCTSPNELKFYGELFWKYKNTGEKNYQRGPPRCPLGIRARHPLQVCPGG